MLSDHYVLCACAPWAHYSPESRNHTKKVIFCPNKAISKILDLEKIPWMKENMYEIINNYMAKGNFLKTDSP